MGEGGMEMGSKLRKLLCLAAMIILAATLAACGGANASGGTASTAAGAASGPTDEEQAIQMQAAGKVVTVEAGKTLEIPKENFASLATEQLMEIESALAARAAA